MILKSFFNTNSHVSKQVSQEGKLYPDVINRKEIALDKSQWMNIHKEQPPISFTCHFALANGSDHDRDRSRDTTMLPLS